MPDTWSATQNKGEVYEQATGIILEMPDSFCLYLDVYGVRLSRTEHFAASVATLVYRPVASHFDVWQGQPKEGRSNDDGMLIYIN